MLSSSTPSPVRDGVTAALPLLIGIVPFGLVAGAASIDAGYSTVQAVALSAVVFAGASQLALIDVLSSDGGVALAVITALTINLRMVLYSASLARRLSHTPLHHRLAAAYFMVDQAYALSITRWDGTDRPDKRLPFYFTVGITLGTCWLGATFVGAQVGASVPDDIPLDFAVPLVFLVLLVPVLQRWPQVVAAAAGGAGALVAAEVGAQRLSIVIGGLIGIAAGVVAELRLERLATPSGGPGDAEEGSDG